MDVHIGREQITSLRDFLVRYLLIVAGILSAWAVNQWNESRHQRRTAEQTRASLIAELSRNVSEVRQAKQFDAAELQKADGMLHELITALKAGPTGRASAQKVLEQWDGRLLEDLVTVERNAWDAAVAGQAVTTLSTGELRNFAGAYAELRRLDGADVGPRADGGDLQSRYAQWDLDRHLGHPDPIELARIFVRWEGRMRYEIALLQAVEDRINSALQHREPVSDHGPSVPR